MNIYDDEVKQEMAESLLPLLLDNVDAVMFCMELLYVYHLWDDLVDMDRERSAEDVNKAFSIVLMEFRRNPFYAANRYDLDPLITLSILQWHDSNVLEAHGEESGLRKAFMLRAYIYQIWAYCAYLVGGLDHYREVGPLIQSMYQEEYDEYKKEFAHA